MKVLQEKLFKVTFLLVSLWFNFYFVLTFRYPSRKYWYGYDYTMYKNETYILVSSPERDFWVAQQDCSDRFNGKLLGPLDTRTAVHFTRWLKHSYHCK